METKPKVSESNIKGQLNRTQFLASVSTGLAAGAGAALLHIQKTVPEWAGPYAPVVLVVISSLLMGLNFLNSGDEADGSEN